MPTLDSREESVRLTPDQLKAFAGRVHTHDSFWRSNLANALRIASKMADRASADGSVKVKGEITFTRVAQIRTRDAVCTRVLVCWEDDFEQQSICEEEWDCDNYVSPL